MDKHVQIKRLTNLLEQTFNGNPWFGDSIMDKLRSIDFELANQVPPNGSKSAAMLVQHIINWRVFAIEKLSGNDQFNIEMNSQEDWPDVSIHSNEDWETLLIELKNTQKELLNLLGSLSDKDLNRQVSGREYDMQYLIEGIIQHDIYHLGQIGVINAQLRNLKKV